VEYKIEGFILKNNNSLHDDLLRLLATSANTFLRDAMSGMYPAVRPHGKYIIIIIL
jgi:myosin heavy subunit